MAFTSVRNGIPNPITLPAPYGGILAPGVGIVIPDTLANVVAALGTPIGIGLEFTALPDNYAGPEGSEVFLAPKTRERLGQWTRENIAASLTDSPIKTATDGSATFNSVLADRAGSIVGIWVILSGAAAGAALTISASVAGATVAATATVVAIADTKAFATFDRNAVPFAAGDLLGMMITTPVGWTATTVDLIAGLVIEA